MHFASLVSSLHIPSLALLGLLGLLLGCESIGGDDDNGVSARAVLAGGGTWQPPADREVTAPSTEPVASLEVQGGAGDAFTRGGGTFTLNVLPRDAQGRPVVEGLTASAFTLDARALRLELPSGVAVHDVTVAEAAVMAVAVKAPTAAGLTGVLLFDSSGSTASTDPDRRRVEAAQAFIAGMPTGTQVAVLDFGVRRGGVFGDRVVSAGLAESRLLLDFTDEVGALTGAVERVTASGFTPMYGALGDALALLEAVHARGAEELFLVVFTDGKATDGSGSAGGAIVRRANALGAPIHTVALTGQGADDEVDLALLQRLAAGTEGLSLTAFEAGQLVDHFQQLTTGTTEARVMLRVQVRLAGSVPAGTYRLRGVLGVSAHGGQAEAPIDLVLGVE